jgi:glycosyltransferase involved in cell wall biosynthesis
MSTLRVAIDLTPAVQGHAGLGRYAGELARALQVSALRDERFSVFYDDPLRRKPPAQLDLLPVSMLAMSNKAWRARVACAYAAHRGQDRLVGSPDVFLATDHLLPRLSAAASVLLLADVTILTHPRAHSIMNRGYLRAMMPHFLRAASAVITISTCSLREAVRQYPSIEHKASVVFPGVPSGFQPVRDPDALREIRARFSLPERFLLYVGTIEPRKNLASLVDAFARLNSPDLGLVIAGRTGWMSEPFFEKVRALGLDHSIVFPGFVADEDLPALYSAADAFVFPSIYEGFGLPVLEAMACGAPVICSNSSSLPEVAGNAAILLPPRDVGAWAGAMTRLARDPALQSDLRERGLRQAALFTWHRAAEQTRVLLRDAAARRPRPAS